MKPLTRALLLSVLLLPLARPASAQDALHEAAAAGDVAKLAAALAKGGDLNRRDAQGRTALMRAAAVGSFYACRELLWAGADASATDKAGQTALDHVGAPSAENVPLRLLLRAYAYLAKEAQRATARPTTPQLVMIMEDTVNYMHPRIAAAYKQNTLEAVGVDGKDDDRNGFVDDVWGWSPVGNAPYEIRQSQLDAYLAHRDAIARILRIHNDCIEGKLDEAEAERLLNEYTNPLAAIMGPLPELTDKKFLDMLMNAAHGSHIAGIILDASENKAKLHTLATNFTEPSKRMLGPDTERILSELHAASCDPEIVLAGIRARLLETTTNRGRIASRYLKAMGAGVANLSFGGGLGFWRFFALTQVNRCQENLWQMDPAGSIGQDTDALIERWALEFYSAQAAELSLVFHENPDVLFVVAAGNDDLDNDSEYTTPAYLARFYPNVITVAAMRADDGICGFSNYGVDSVDIGAPGQDILSTVIPEAPVYMNGTSMAAPYVAGVAALMRALAPTMTAAELRRLIAYTARDIEQLHHYVSSGGVIDREILKGLVQGTPRARSNTQARIALNAGELSDELYPRHAEDARVAAEKAMQLDATNVEAWRAKAVLLLLAGDHAKALEAIDRAVALDPRSEPAWMNRATITGQLGDADELFASLGKAIDLLAGQGEAAEFRRARHLGLRASLHLQLGQQDEAARDARQAREINPGVDLSEELEALL